MKTQRSRIVRINNKIIITNYKCMFSSLNKLKICELNPKNSEEYEKIMLFRDPYLRTISCFLNWMIRLPLENNILNRGKKDVINCNLENNAGGIGWLIKILLMQKEFDFNNYKVLLRENNIIELFKIYLKLLPKIKNKNAHMHSQVKILKNENFNVDIFINIDKKDQIKLLIEKIGQEIPHVNVSNIEDKCLLMNFLNNHINYKNIIHNIYIDDFNLLPLT